jgi:hypothetical protein
MHYKRLYKPKYLGFLFVWCAYLCCVWRFSFLWRFATDLEVISKLEETQQTCIWPRVALPSSNRDYTRLSGIWSSPIGSDQPQWQPQVNSLTLIWTKSLVETLDPTCKSIKLNLRLQLGVLYDSLVLSYNSKTTSCIVFTDACSAGRCKSVWW